MSLASGNSIRSRLTTCLGVLLAAIALQTVSGLILQWRQHALSVQQGAMTQVTADQMLGDMKHDGIQGDIFRLRDALAAGDTVKRDATLKDLSDDIGVINAMYGYVFAQSYPAALQAQVNATVAPQHDYVMHARTVSAALVNHTADAPQALNDFTASFDRFEHVQEVLAEAIKAERDAETASAALTYRLSWVLALLAVASAGAAVWWVVRIVEARVMGPLGYLHGELQRMAGGDFSVKIKGDINGDEIEQMSAIACRMRLLALDGQRAEREASATVQALSVALGHLADSDLEYAIEEVFADNYEALRGDFNGAMGALRVAIGKVRVGATALSTSIGEISKAAEDLAMRNEQQAATLEETAAATNQAYESVRGTAEDAATVRKAIAAAQADANDGGAVVGQATQAMAAIERSAQEIGQIIGVIDGIAFQTNLLALNAGVEAARAGDAGKGFAVVANEVRALAQRSADAAKDIKGLITTSSQQVSQGVSLVGATGEMLIRIGGQIDQVTGLVNGIATSAADQAENLEMINTAMRQLDSVTQQNAAMVEETNASARNLTGEATELTRLVKQFRTREPGRTAHVERPGLVRKASLTQPGDDALTRALAEFQDARPASVVAMPAPRPAPVVQGALAVKADDWSEF